MKSNELWHRIGLWIMGIGGGISITHILPLVFADACASIGVTAIGLMIVNTLGRDGDRQ